MNAQLPLAITLPDTARWENFFAGSNSEAIAELRSKKSAQTFFLWGPPGVGKTHLLQAACHDASTSGEQALYLPLADARSMDVGIFEDLENCSIVCVDELDAIAGQSDWELALFHFFNRCLLTGTRMIFAARDNLAMRGIALPDLRTRLRSGLVYHLQPLSDSEKIAALRYRAAYRGIDFPEDAAQYLLNRAPRSTTELFRLLEKLDWAALTARRRVTLNFLREWYHSIAP